MLIDSLRILIEAGKEAFCSTSSLPVIQEEILQVRQGHLTFPSMGEVGFSGGTLQSIRLGCDATLCSQLAERIHSTGSDSGFEILTNRFLDKVIEKMGGRHPRGWVESLEVGPINLPTRGIRSFGFRLQTEIGQFYLMAEVPSKSELEMAKGNEYIKSMTARYFPEGWTSRRELSQVSEIDDFLLFLRKTETDVQVEVEAVDGLYTIHTGVMVENTRIGNRRALKMIMDLSGPEGKALIPGDKVNIRVGVQDRAITFMTEYLGEGKYPVTDSAHIKCVNFSLPRLLRIGQMRRAFRINANERIPVEIECVDPLTNDSPWFSGGVAGHKAKGRLADLSFSGVRIIAQRGQLVGCANEGSRVVCRVFFPGEPEPLRVMGIIRRTTISLADGDNQQDEIGLEFLVPQDSDRTALEWIRQYVLSKQRSWLAERIHVAGGSLW